MLFCGPGLLGLLLILLIFGRKVNGTLPFSDRGYSRWKLGQSMQAVGVVAGIVMFIVGAVLARDAPGLGLFVFFLGICGFVFCLVAPRIWKGPRCLRIESDRLVRMDLPSEQAVEAIVARLGGRPPPGALCPNHPGTRAVGVCVRCGSFGCAACLARPAEHAARRCAACGSHARK